MLLLQKYNNDVKNELFASYFDANKAIFSLFPFGLSKKKTTTLAKILSFYKNPYPIIALIRLYPWQRKKNDKVVWFRI